MNAFTGENMQQRNYTTQKAELLFKGEATTGEGAIWHPERQSLFWVDIEGKTLYEYSPEDRNRKRWLFNRMVSTVVPETSGHVVVALQDEIIQLDLKTGNVKSITRIDDREGTVRCNDGKCDPDGRFWVGTIAKKAPPGSARLYTVLHNGSVITRLTGLSNSNGIAWDTHRNLMYHIDTPTKQIMQYKYAPETGNITFDRVAVTIPENTGKPDGMTIDSEGNLWVGHWGGYGVYCYNPSNGKLLSKIEIPAPNVPSCAFGGANLDILYITTARSGMQENELEKYPDSGSLFVCRPGIKGVEASYFTK